MRLNVLYESDFNLRSLERSARSGPGLENQIKALMSRVRAGMIPYEHVTLAADLGHPIAKDLVPDAIELTPPTSEFDGHLARFLHKWYPILEDQLDEVYRRFYREWNQQILPQYEYLADEYTDENERIIQGHNPIEKARHLTLWLGQYADEEGNEDLYWPMFYRHLNDVLMPSEFIGEF